MGAEGTKLDEDFVKMEKVNQFESPLKVGIDGGLTLTDPLCALLLFQSVEVINTLLTELLSRTTEFLQPNPGSERTLVELRSLSSSCSLQLNPRRWCACL